jgi:hypothetical protein
VCLVSETSPGRLQSSSDWLPRFFVPRHLKNPAIELDLADISRFNPLANVT